MFRHWIFAFAVVALCSACGSHASHGHDGGTGDGGLGDGGVPDGGQLTCNHSDDPSSFNVDISTVTVSGAITVNGVTPPAAEWYGTITLRDTTTADSVTLAQVGDATYAPKQIIAGTYDVYYSWNSTDAANPIALPRNGNALVESGVDLTSSRTLNVDIKTIALNGSITLNGAPSPAGESYGTVYLRNTSTGDSLILGQLGTATYTAKQIVPGTYDVYYSWNSEDTANPIALPRNGNALLQSQVVLTSSQQFNVDVKTITLAGAVTLNGAPSPANDPYGTVYLRNPNTGDSLVLGQLGTAAYTTKQIIAGTYDVYYGWNNTDTASTIALPRNTNARVKANMASTSSQTFTVDLATVTLSGAITMNGAPPPASERFGSITLRNTDTGDSVLLGTLGDASYTSKQILPGTYDVYYSWNPADTASLPALPRNSNARLRTGVALTSSQQLVVDVPTVTLSGAVTMNGAPGPANERFGTVSLHDSATDDQLVVGTLGDAAYATKQIVPGTYDIYYSWITSDTVSPPLLPRNASAQLQKNVALTSTQMLSVDVPTVTLAGAITVNTTVPVDTFGSVMLVDDPIGDQLLLGNTGDPKYTNKQIVPGVYDIVYQWDPDDASSTIPLPRNLNHVLGCTKLQRGP